VGVGSGVVGLISIVPVVVGDGPAWIMLRVVDGPAIPVGSSIVGLELDGSVVVGDSLIQIALVAIGTCAV